MPGRLTYDLLYRVGAARWSHGWDRGEGAELVDLVVSGRLEPGSLPPGRAVDLGCGSGANAILLAEHGFDVVGVDFSSVAVRLATEASAVHDLSSEIRFVVGDVTQERIPGVEGLFDLVVVYNTLQDLLGPDREGLAATVGRLTRPGGHVLLWCYESEVHRLPLFSLRGPSRLLPFVLGMGEVHHLFGVDFDIERLPEPELGSGAACFHLIRRESAPRPVSRGDASVCGMGNTGRP